MAVPRTNPILISSLVILGIGIVFHIVSTATPGWLTFSRSTASGRIGLFQVCNLYTCVSIPDQMVKEDVIAVRALLIISILLEGLAGLFTIFHLVKCWTTLANTICSLLCCIAASLMSMAAAIVFGLSFFNYPTLGEAFFLYDLDYSFGMCIAGSALVAMGGGLIFSGGLNHHRALSALQNTPSGIVHQPQIVYQAQPTSMMVAGQQFQPQPMYLVPQVPYIQQGVSGQYQMMSNVPQVPYVQQGASGQYQMVSNGSQVPDAQQGVGAQSQVIDNNSPMQKQK